MTIFSIKSNDNLQQNKKQIPNKVLPFVWYFLKKCELSFFMTFILCATGSNIAFFGSQYFLKLIIDGISTNNFTINGTIQQFLLFCFLNYSDILIDIAIVRLYYNIESGIQSNVRNTMFQYIIKHNIVFFNNNLVGSLVSKINDLTDGSRIIVDQGLNSLQYVLLFIITMIIFAFQSMKLAVIFFGLLIIYSIVFIPLSNKSKKLWKDNSISFGKLLGNVSDCFTSVFAIKSFSREKYEKA